MLGVEALASLSFEAPGKPVSFSSLIFFIAISRSHFSLLTDGYNIIGHNPPRETVYNHRDQHVQHSNHPDSKSGIGYG